MGSAFSATGMRREPTADGLPVYGAVAARTAWMWAGCGCWRRAGSGRLSRAGSAVTLEVPRPRHRCLWGALSADIPENAPGRRGRRCRAAGYGAENDSAVTAAPGAPGYRVRPQRPRGGGTRRGGGGARRGGGGARRGGGGARRAARGRRCAARGGRLGCEQRQPRLPASEPPPPTPAATLRGQGSPTRVILEHGHDDPAGPGSVGFRRREWMTP